MPARKPSKALDGKACRPEHTHLFYSSDEDEQCEAKRICYRCPVRETCLQMNMTETDGIWGGLDERERRQAYRRRRIDIRREMREERDRTVA